MKLSKLGTIKDAHCEFRIKTLYKFIANLHIEKISLQTVKAVVVLKAFFSQGLPTIFRGWA